MTKFAIRYGLLTAAIIIIGWGVGTIFLGPSNPEDLPDFGKMEILGFASMFIAFSALFFGVRKYRESVLGGSMSFKQGFLMGLYIGSIASAIYVIGWMIYQPIYAPDFLEQYSTYQEQNLIESGASDSELTASREKMAEYGQLYENPVSKAAFTLLEIFPIAILISLITALILKRKPSNNPENSIA